MDEVLLPEFVDFMVMLLGKKIGMTQVYNNNDELLPVTVIQAGPCVVMQVKTPDKDGYNAVQLGYDDVKPSRRKQPQVGHAEKVRAVPKKFVREMSLPANEQPEYKAGDRLTVSVFADVKSVDITGTGKGKGFAGPMKLHGFKGFPASHGTERKHRAPGSISSFASDAGKGGNLKKGKKMAGRMGGKKVTTKNHALVSVSEKENLLIVKGAIPGPAGSYCIIRSSRNS